MRRYCSRFSPRRAGRTEERVIDAIPEELRGLTRWVAWRTEERDGKETKPPLRCDGAARASVIDPETWCGFEDAVLLVRSGAAEGLGLVLSDEDDLAGVDLDDCFLENGDLHPVATAIVLRLGSYTERSPSGRGLHVLFRAELNGPRNRTGTTPWGGKLEIYDRARYLTVTGDHLPGTPRTIEARQTELNGVIAEFMPPPPERFERGERRSIQWGDRELLDRAFAARNGAKLRRLFEGDCSGYSSHSEADLALCSVLAFWTGGDPDRVDCLFRSSGLMREKWDRADYRRRTIGAAVAGLHDVYEPSDLMPSSSPRRGEGTAEHERFRLVPLDWEPILEGGVPELEYLSEPYLPARKRIWAVGPAESGKSIWAAFKTAELTRTGLVVAYVSQENGLDEDVRRFLRLRPDFEFLRLCVDHGLDLVDPQHVEALLELSEGAAMTVLDTLTACWSGDENDNGALAAFDRDVMKRIISEVGASPLVLDHTGNPQAFVRRRGVTAPRGASSKGQKTDYLLEFRASGESAFTIEHAKGRGAGRKEARRLFRIIDGDDGTLEVVEADISADDEIEVLANALAEKVIEARRMITKELRANAKALGYGADRTSAALAQLASEEPPRVRVAWETVETRSGRQRAKVWTSVVSETKADAPWQELWVSS